MKNIPFLLFFIISLHSPAQEIDFKANQKITDPDFKAFVDLFEEKELPISTCRTPCDTTSQQSI